MLFDKFSSGIIAVRIWNVLLGALEAGARRGDVVITSRISHDNSPDDEVPSISSILDGKKCTEAVQIILNLMRTSKSDDETLPKMEAPFPNSQSYCIVAAALQHSANSGPGLALELFRNATIEDDVSADGRFINALLRCCGDDIDAALSCWKQDFRAACLAYEGRPRTKPISVNRSINKNLVAAYNGLLYVCGRARRPDIAVRLVYAMNRESIEPNDVSFNNYLSGKRWANMQPKGKDKETSTREKISRLLPKISMLDQYENVLYVECTKYDQRSKRMAKDTRVRIIV